MKKPALIVPEAVISNRVFPKTCGEYKEIESIEEERKAYFAELGKSKGGHRK